MGADEAAYVKKERIAVPVVESGWLQLRTGPEFATHLRLEDGYVDYQTEEHHEAWRTNIKRMRNT